MKGRLRSLLLGVLICCLFIQRTSAASRSYKQVLKDTGMTLPGDYVMFENTNRIRCASKCSLAGCDGWAWDELTKECRIYNKLFIYLEPVHTSQGPLVTYLPDDTHVIFITIITDDTMTWNRAKADCEARGETMLYIPEEEEAVRLFKENGAFYVGVHKIEGLSGPWTDLFGNVIQEADISWAPTEPSIHSYALCISRYSAKGYYDVRCVYHDDGSPKKYFCTLTLE